MQHTNENITQIIYVEKQDRSVQLKFENMWVCDFETITAETKYWERNKKTGITYGFIKNLTIPYLNYQFIKIDDLINYITTTRYCDQTIFFHNLSFDGVFILDWAVKNGYTVTNDITDYNQISVFRTTGNKIYSIEMSFKTGKRKMKKIRFQCSALLLSSSVEKLGEAIGLDKYTKDQKEDINFHTREPEKTLEKFVAKNETYCLYCQNDVEIVRICLLDFYIAILEFMKSEQVDHLFYQIIDKPTIGSVSVHLQEIMFIKKYGVVDTMYIHSYNERKIMDQFTQGGYTQPNPSVRGQLVEKNWFIIDLKSAYPAVMKGNIPVGNMILSEPDDYDHITNNYACFQEIHYDYIKCIHEVPMLKNWGDKTSPDGKKYDRYFSSAENYTTWLLKEEAEALEKHHVFKNKKILNQYWYRLDNPLKEFVDCFYGLKELHKKNAPAKSHTYKIILNSGYGVHCKQLDKLSVFVVDNENGIERGKKLYEQKENIDLNKPFRHSYIQNTNLGAYECVNLDELLKFPHKAIANYITAKTRIKLYNGIDYFGSDHYANCDTDSLFLYDIDKEIIDSYCGTQLGDWEIEKKSGPKFKIDRPKQYRMFDATGMILKKGSAGFNLTQKDYDKLDEHGEVVVDNASLVYQRVDGGLLLVPITKAILLDYDLAVDKKAFDMNPFIGDVDKEIDLIIEQKRMERKQIMEAIYNKVKGEK